MHVEHCRCSGLWPTCIFSRNMFDIFITHSPQFDRTQYAIEALRQQNKYKNHVQKAQNIPVGWSNFGVVQCTSAIRMRCVCSRIMFLVESALKAYSVGYSTRIICNKKNELASTKFACPTQKMLHSTLYKMYTGVYPCACRRSEAAVAVRSRSFCIAIPVA